MKDPIIQELWKIKDKIAKDNAYNIDKLAKSLKEKERKRKGVATLAKSKKAKK
jgi:hypothetical protein